MIVYGDGKQIRDLLWIDDLVNLYSLAIRNIDTAAGRVYNAGGGPSNTLSLLELISILSDKSMSNICPAYADWRPGDQRVFVADISKANRELGWRPNVSVQEGVNRLASWTVSQRELVESVFCTT